MRLIYCLLVILLLSVPVTLRGQEYLRANNWYFGYNAGLSFSTGSPVAVSGQLYSTEASAAISDPNTGQLLFYTDGIKVWDRNHALMSNGTGLMGCNSSTQGALIVPRPQSDSLYYIFTVDCYENNLANGLRYSVVDMSLNNGFGDVTVKNVLLADTMTERLTGVKHANGEDIWVVAHESGTRRFMSYLVTAAGIDTNEVVTEIGAIPSVYACIKASPDGDWLGLVNYAMGYDSLNPSMELFTFDDNSGVLDSHVFADTSEWMYNGYGASFSPDNTKFYVAGGPIFQYDLTAGNPLAIKTSRTLIGAGMSLQLAPDGKIYVARSYTISDSLFVINDPNEAGTLCDPGFALLTSPGTDVIGLPNFIESYFNGLTVDINQGPGQPEVWPYPNPTTGVLIVPGELITEHSVIRLYDMQGEQVFSIDAEKNKEITLNIPGVAPGIYCLQIKSKHKTTSVRIVVIQ